MLAMEELLCELIGDDRNEHGLPPGFRFHPTDEELITFYLASKVFNGSFCGVQIAEVDLNRCEPWELPDVAKMGEREWYFFSLRDRKYPTGLRTNRATGAGYWKATGKDREVYSASNGALLGMKKTLVFYKGRAPRGEKTKWVMHEYRLEGDFSCRHTCKEEWVICRIFDKTAEKKNVLSHGQGFLLEPSSPHNSTALPCLLQPIIIECQPQPPNNGLQNPYLSHHQENHLKRMLLSSLQVSQSNHTISMNAFQFQTSNSTPVAISTNAGINENMHTNVDSSLSPSMLLKSHQDCILKEQTTATKQCKTEPDVSHFQLPDANNLSWVAKKIYHHHQEPFQYPLSSEMDCSVMGITTEAEITANETSTSIACNRAAFQMVLDPPPIRLSAESWPSDS